MFWPTIADSGFDPFTWNQMCEMHALPVGWETMDYFDFLAKRRRLMAAVVRRAYESLQPVGSRGRHPGRGGLSGSLAAAVSDCLVVMSEDNWKVCARERPLGLGGTQNAG